MNIWFYQIHDLLIRVQAPERGMPWVFQKLDYFAVEHDGRAQIDIDISLGPVDWDVHDCLNVDHRYYAKTGEIWFTGQWNGVSWRSHWSGLESGPIRVRLEIPWHGVFRFPWLMQADWVCYLYIIKPLSELIWSRRQRFVLHASAAVRGGVAAVFAGFGSSLKTSFVMGLVRRGWSLLGDDQVLLTPEGLLPLPVGLRTFDFRVHRLPDEYLTVWRTCRLGIHLMERRTPRVEVGGLSRIGSLNVLVRTNHTTVNTLGLTPDEAAQRVAANCQAETLQSIRDSPPVIQPLIAYDLMFPGFRHDSHWPVMRRQLTKQLEGLPIRLVELTNRWDERFMEHIALPSPQRI